MNKQLTINNVLNKIRILFCLEIFFTHIQCFIIKTLPANLHINFNASVMTSFYNVCNVSVLKTFSIVCNASVIKTFSNVCLLYGGGWAREHRAELVRGVLQARHPSIRRHCLYHEGEYSNVCLLYTVQCVQECNPGIRRQYFNICCIVHAIYRHVILAFDIIVFIMKVSTIFVYDTVHHFIVQYISMSS